MKKGFRILKFKKDRPIFEVKEISKSFDGRPILKKLSLEPKLFVGLCHVISDFIKNSTSSSDIP